MRDATLKSCQALFPPMRLRSDREEKKKKKNARKIMRIRAC